MIPFRMCERCVPSSSIARHRWPAAHCWDLRTRQQRGLRLRRPRRTPAYRQTQSVQANEKSFRCPSNAQRKHRVLISSLRSTQRGRSRSSNPPRLPAAGVRIRECSDLKNRRLLARSSCFHHPATTRHTEPRCYLVAQPTMPRQFFDRHAPHVPMQHMHQARERAFRAQWFAATAALPRLVLSRSIAPILLCTP